MHSFTVNDVTLLTHSNGRECAVDSCLAVDRHMLDPHAAKHGLACDESIATCCLE